MERNIHTLQTPNFELVVLKKLEEIEKRLDAKNLPKEPSERYLQPKELCAVYGITRNTLEKFFQAGLLTPLRFYPTSRKIYVAESQIKQVLKSQLPIIEN